VTRTLYELRTYDPTSEGALITHAPTEAQLVHKVRASFPISAVIGDRNGALVIWRSMTEALTGNDPAALAWKPDDAPPWDKRLWTIILRGFR
jgi:hypothetical protein